MHIRLSKIWEDDDGMLELELAASSDGYASQIDFYVYPEQLATFGNALVEFSGKIDQDCSWRLAPLTRVLTAGFASVLLL